MTELKKELAVSEADQADSETPLVVLRLRRKFYVFSYVFVALGLVYFYLGIIFPVLTTGDFSTMLVSDNVRISRRVILFISSLLVVPFFSSVLILSIWRVGDAYFYEDKLVVIALFSGRKIIIPYDKMYINKKNGLLTITSQKLPTWSDPWNLMKVKYFEGVGFVMNFSDPKIAGMKIGITIWENLADGPKAMLLLKEKAFSFTEK